MSIYLYILLLMKKALNILNIFYLCFINSIIFLFIILSLLLFGFVGVNLMQWELGLIESSSVFVQFLYNYVWFILVLVFLVRNRDFFFKYYDKIVLFFFSREIICNKREKKRKSVKCKKVVKRYIRHKFRFGGGYRLDFRTGNLKFYSHKIKYTKGQFKKLVRSFEDENLDNLENNYNIMEKQVEHPTFYHLDKENRRLIKFNKTHSRRVYNEETKNYEKTIYIGKDEGGRKEYMTNIQVHMLGKEKRDIVIDIRDIIAEGKTIDFEIPRIMEKDLMKMGIPIEEIRMSSRVNELDKWSEMLAKWED